VDPDGERPLFFWEKISITTILGRGHEQILQGIDYNKSRVTPDQFKSGIAGYHSFPEGDVDAYIASEPNLGEYGISLPNGSIYLPKNARNAGNIKLLMKALFMHEIFHQVQYAQSGKSYAFNKFLTDKNSYSNPYDYDLQSLIGKKLGDIPTLEAQAQFIEDFAEGYYQEKSFFKRNDNFSTETKQRAQILKDSGLNSRAINRVLNP
jgi:hypothetical protein